MDFWLRNLVFSLYISLYNHVNDSEVLNIYSNQLESNRS